MTEHQTRAATADEATPATAGQRIAELELWQKAAMMFRVRVEGRPVYLTRFDNHFNIVDDGKWLACWQREMYASFKDGQWQFAYKRGNAFDTPGQALAAARAAMRHQIATEQNGQQA